MRPKTVAVIQARMGSTRLPDKILRQAAGRPLLEIQLERLRHAKSLDLVVIATTGSPKDDPIAEFCRERGVACYRGSERDVLDRTYRAARRFGAEVVVRLTSDCPLIDPEVVDRVVGAHREGSWDFVANTAPPPGTYPDGMDVEVFSFELLETAWKEAVKPSDREHVTFFFWKQPERFRLRRVEAPEDWSSVRLTVDYADDLAFVETILRRFEGCEKPATAAQIVEFVRASAKDPNRGHAFGEGWAPSLKKDAGSSSPAKASPLRLEAGDKAFEAAARLIPTGAQTFSKAPLQFVQGTAPKVLARGSGSKVWDLDGNEFIDYTLGLGPAILGHSHPEVNRAAYECADDLFNAPPLPHPLEATLAAKIQALVPCAEMVRFGKNGSDATAGAVRLARAYTGRDVIAATGYHGWQDWYIGATTRNKGVPEAVRRLTVPFQYNKLETLQKVFEDHPGGVAGVILEPVNFWEPKDGFLRKVRELCDKHGALLIFDEVITGFRLHMGGAQAVYGVTPDLAALGKAAANGYPLSILCGKAEIMRVLEEAFFSFTFGGELPSIAAALKTIEILERDRVLPHIHALGRRLRDGFNQAARDLDMPYARAIGLDFWPEYELDPAQGYSKWEMLTLFQQELVRRGILTRPGLFISGAHGGGDADFTLAAMREALAVLACAVKDKKVVEWTDGQLIQPVIRA